MVAAARTRWPPSWPRDGIRLPPGSPHDPPDTQTVGALAARNEQLFLTLVDERGVAAFPAAVDLLRRLRAREVAAAVVSASRNAARILEAAGVAELVDVRVDGVDARQLDLPGEPAPATLLEAARQLGVEPGQAAVVDDAVAGVQAAATAGSGWSWGWTAADNGRGCATPVPTSSSTTSASSTSAPSAPTRGCLGMTA